MEAAAAHFYTDVVAAADEENQMRTMRPAGFCTDPVAGGFFVQGTWVRPEELR